MPRISSAASRKVQAVTCEREPFKSRYRAVRKVQAATAGFGRGLFTV
jgi:hypothetical protein